MKKTSFIFLSVASLFLAVILFASCQSGNKIIEKPICLTNNGQSLEISRITLTDTITVLDMVANGMPDTWIKIAKTSTLTDDKGNVLETRSPWFSDIVYGDEIRIPNVK